MLKPIIETEMQVVLAEEISRLDDLVRPTWKKHRIPLQQIPCGRPGFPREALFIVARHTGEVVLFDDVSDEFATGTVDDDGFVRRWTTYGERLGAALRHFPASVHGPREALEPDQSA